MIGVYAPEEGKDVDTEMLYEELQKQINGCNKCDYFVLLGALN